MARKRSQLAPPAPAPEVDDAKVADLPSIIKQAYLDTFEKIGGVKGMVLWARAHPAAFYRQFAMLAPKLERTAKNKGVKVQVSKYGRKAADPKPADGPPAKTATDDDPPAA